MEPSVLSLEVSPIITIQNSAIVLTGQLVPEISNENVTLYAKTNSDTWTIIGTAITQQDGSFKYIWKAGIAGSHAICAGWSGNEWYTGAMSAAKNATVLPLFLTALIGIAIVAVTVGIVVSLIAKHGQQQYLEPLEPRPQ